MMQCIRKRVSILTMILVILGNAIQSYAQEFKVESFEIAPKDLSARTEGRVDGNGRKCAVIKVFVKDAITDTDGPVVGEIRDRGMEKWVYVSHDAKQVGLLFKEHMPLLVIFADYDFPTVTGQMTYILKLTESIPNTGVNYGYNGGDTHSIDIFGTQVYHTDNVIECDGNYTGDMDNPDYSKLLHVDLPDDFNRQAFSFECQFYPDSLKFVNRGYDYQYCPLFVGGYGAFKIKLHSNGSIIVSTDYNDKHVYETNCQYVQNKWNDFKVSFKHGKLRMICNGLYDEMDIIASQGWFHSEIWSECTGDGQTFRGWLQNVFIKTDLE